MTLHELLFNTDVESEDFAAVIDDLGFHFEQGRHRYLNDYGHDAAESFGYFFQKGRHDFVEEQS